MKKSHAVLLVSVYYVVSCIYSPESVPQSMHMLGTLKYIAKVSPVLWALAEYTLAILWF